MDDMMNEKKTDASQLPPLYSSVDLLHREKHKNLRIRSDIGWKFSKALSTVPLTVREFVAASRAAPVVFLQTEEGYTSVFLTGLTPGQNGLVQEDGSWVSNSYIPAYLRRYPFIVIDTDIGKRMGLDPNAKHFAKSKGEPLFESNKECEALVKMRDLCIAFDEAWAATQAFLKSLETENVLVPGQVTFKTDVDGERKFNGFHIVDFQKVEALEDSKVAEWQKKGWLEALYAHRASLDRWSALPLPTQSSADLVA